jgi:carboxymethylenebutenolidase
MSERVGFSTRGGPCEGELGEPSGDGEVGGLVVIQEWHGINAEMKKKVQRFAGEGFLTLAPDLYHGKVAKDDHEAGQLMGALDWARALGDIAGAVKHLQESPRSNGKVGVLGFCLGGALAFATAATLPGLAAVVPFYGIPDTSKFDWSKVDAPILAHFAGHDDWASPDKARALARLIEAGGKSIELHVYEGAGHAFMRDTDPSKYHEPSAKKAWERTLAFLHQKLG